MNRRAFLRLSSAGVFSMAARALPSAQVPKLGDRCWAERLPIPASARRTLGLQPALRMDEHGFLALASTGGPAEPRRVQVLPTAWNLQKNRPRHRMWDQHAWGVVLHWDGAPTGALRSAAQMVNGLNHSMDIRTGEEVQNSAHFGVGPARLTRDPGDPNDPLSVAQLQHPSPDGVPYIASHLRPEVGKPDWRLGNVHASLATLRHLRIRSILTDIYDGVRFDPNYRMLAIEMQGRRYERDFPANMPSAQQMANTLSLIIALMRAYDLGPWDVVGHFELQHDKPDPGKLFIAGMRYLIGLQALTAGPPWLVRRVFGGLDETRLAVNYFHDLAAYLRMVSTPDTFISFDQFFGFTPTFDSLLEAAVGEPPVGSGMVGAY